MMTTYERTTDNEQAAIAEAIEILDDAGYGVDEHTVSVTADTIDDFASKWGTPSTSKLLEDVPHAEWRSVQRAKGEPRGTLVVIDFGGFRVANFC